MNILVLYNSRYVCTSVANYLARMGNVEVVGMSPKTSDVLDLITKEHPHMVIIDAFLVSGKDLSLLKRIKTQTDIRHLFVVSTANFLQYRLECLKRGADYYFQLPEEIEALRVTVLRLTKLQDPQNN